MLCFRCGSYNQDVAVKCSVCSQAFTEPSGHKPVARQKSSAQKVIGGLSVDELIDDRYVVRGKIGRGGVGAVYRAYDRQKDRDVALKLMSGHLLQTEDERDVFSKSVKSAKKLNHENIARVYGEGRHKGQCYFVCELLDGLTLRKIISLRHGKLQSFSYEEINPILQQLASGLRYAHKSTWHGELRPENIIILPEVLKITDFNVIKGMPLKPFLGVAKGKEHGFAYLAPELRVESSTTDTRADIYSLGVVMCELVTGHVYAGQWTKSLCRALEKLPTKVEGLLRRSVAEHPDGRFSSASDFANKFSSALKKVGLERLPVPVFGDDAKKLPPSPPNNTAVSAADSEHSRSDNRSLEEVRPSQVVLLQTDTANALGRPAERSDGQAKPEGAGSPREESADQAEDTDIDDTKIAVRTDLSSHLTADSHAEDLEETLFRQDDDELVPPPFPTNDDALSSSYESMPASIIHPADGHESTDKQPRSPQNIHDAETHLSESMEQTGQEADDAADAFAGERPGRAAATASKPNARDADHISLSTSRPGKTKRSGFPIVPVVAVLAVVALIGAGVAYFSKYTGTVAPREAGPGSKIIGPAGGVLERDGVIVVVPGVALKEEKVLELHRDERAAPDGYIAYSPIYTFSPKGTVFSRPVKVTIPFVGDRALAKTFWQASDGTWSRAESTISDNVASSRVTEISSAFVGALQKDIATEASAAPDGGSVAVDSEVDQEGAGEPAAALPTASSTAETASGDSTSSTRDALASVPTPGTSPKTAPPATPTGPAESTATDPTGAVTDAPKDQPDASVESSTVAASELKCPKGMKKVTGGVYTIGTVAGDSMKSFGEKSAAATEVSTFCIDYYEYPNSKKREPTTGLSFSAAKAACAGRGKRLCAESEWEAACKGTAGRRFPYGNQYSEGACNVGDPSTGLVPASSFKKCRSPSTIFMMSGNAEEWVAEGNVVKGGSYSRKAPSARCSARREVSAATATATTGARCCATPNPAEQ